MNQRLIHAVFVLALPVIVAWFGLSVFTAILLVLAVLLWRQLITLAGLLAPPKGPELELETISASHFVEKVRWCMDRLGIEYSESHWVGILGVFFKGRTVPQLKVRTGKVISVIGDSPAILRYLWGRYATELGDKAQFLEPTEERLEWERRIDHYGTQLQVWIYYHSLDHSGLTMHAWGRNSKRIPLWQRWVMVAMYPVFAGFIRKAFRINDGHYASVKEKIGALLKDVEDRLESENDTILHGETSDFVDISFAAMTGLWLQPQGFGGGAADDVMLGRDQLPQAMRNDVEEWIAACPKTERYVQRLYREQRVRHVDAGNQ